MPTEGLQLGRYRLLRLVGHGATSEVYLAEDQRIARQVALKVLQSEDLTSEEARDAALLFQREAQTIARLNHPNILPLFDFGEEVIDGKMLVYLVMPYCPEGSLAKWLRERSETLVLQPLEVVHMVQQAAEALEYAHEQQIVHRDVKPSNFLVRSRRNTTDRLDLLLADFGIARFAQGTHVSKTIRGTPSYMAPEQWRGNPVPATDQYALAIMVYELLTSRPPFLGTQHQMMYHHCITPAPPPSTVSVRITPAVDAVILRALAKQPQDRFPSITAFASAFQQAVQPAIDPPITLLPSPPTPVVITASPPVPLPPSPMPPNVKDTPRISTSSERSNDLRTTVEPVVIETIPGLPSLRTSPRRLLLGGLALLIVIASIASLFSFGRNALISRVADATAIANQGTVQAMRATSTVNAATASAEFTKTARLTATASATVNPYELTHNRLALNETLDRNSGAQWDEIPGSCAFTTAGYHVSSPAPATLAQVCVARQTNFSDMTFEVQMNVLTGNGGGILLRATDSVSYYFRISPDRHYTLFVCAGARTLCKKFLVTDLSSQISLGLHQTMLIAVVARGKSIELYVNHVRINGVNDNSSFQGQIGVVAEPGSEVVFSHARVWTV